MDYKEYEEGKYPAPEDRKYARHYPKKEELFVYGEDVPVPVSFDELRAKYNEDDKNPLVLADLEGYKVPPLHNKNFFIQVHGGAFVGGGGNIYGAGTFREDKYTINKELGIQHSEITAIREEKAKEAQTEAVITFLKEVIGDEMDFEDVNRYKNELAVEGLTLWTLRTIEEKGAPREAVNFLKLYLQQQAHKDEIIKRHRKKEMTAEEAIDLIKQVKESGILDIPDITIIDGEVEDIE